MNWTSLIIDICLIVLLGFTIIYAYKLNKNIKKMGAEKSDMEKMLAGIKAAIINADRANKALQLTAQELNGDLEEKINEAKGLSEELGFILETGEALANRLSNIQVPKPILNTTEQSIAMPPPPPAARPNIVSPQNLAAQLKETSAPLSRSEQELLARIASKAG